MSFNIFARLFGIQQMVTPQLLKSTYLDIAKLQQRLRLFENRALTNLRTNNTIPSFVEIINKLEECVNLIDSGKKVFVGTVFSKDERDCYEKSIESICSCVYHLRSITLPNRNGCICVNDLLDELFASFIKRLVFQVDQYLILFETTLIHSL